VSPAFDKHIFWPSPEKKPKKVVSRHKGELFPACASSQEWRDVYKQKELDKATLRNMRPGKWKNIGKGRGQQRSKKLNTQDGGRSSNEGKRRRSKKTEGMVWYTRV